jgi:uncharacterized membrane protein
MNIRELSKSRYLTKEDVGAGMLVTVKGGDWETVSATGQPEETKWVCYFNEVEKGIVINPTNGHLMAMVTGSEDSDGWIGKKIVLYTDPTVTNKQGKIVGGIRIRAPKGQAAKATAPKPAPVNVSRNLPPSQQPTPEEIAEAASDNVDDSEVPF